MKKKILLIIIPLLLSSCDSTKTEQFSSIRSCMDGIQDQTGEGLKITGNYPNKVVGESANGNPFSCIEIVDSSGKSTYEGTFDATKKTQEKLSVKDQEKRQKGFHCLSGWDGSHPTVISLVKEKMRNPNSFEHIETKISPVNSTGIHKLVMKYRAANGFGGLTISSASAKVVGSSCKATITSLN